MSQIENAGAVMEKTLHQFNEKVQKKLLRHAVFSHWKEILPHICKDIFPIKIDGETLILYSRSSAAKDNIKYLAKDIIDSVNEKVGHGEELFKNIDFAKNFDQVEKLKNFKTGKKKSPQPEVANIELTAEEIAACEKNISEIKNPDIKKIALESLIQLKKTEQIKIQNGWHKCKICDALCAPEEIICEVCRVRERNKMRRDIRQIFSAEPDIKFQTVLQRIKKKFPHLKEECSLKVVEAERSALICKLAKKISFSDTKSDAVKTLVMIYRRLPKEKLTDAIIERTIKELRFNFANQPTLETKTFKKFAKGGKV